MPEEILKFKVEETDEKKISIPFNADNVTSEAIGDVIKYAAQDGYNIVAVLPIQREVGTQRDPETKTLGVKIRMAKT